MNRNQPSSKRRSPAVILAAAALIFSTLACSFGLDSGNFDLPGLEATPGRQVTRIAPTQRPRNTQGGDQGAVPGAGGTPVPTVGFPAPGETPGALAGQAGNGAQPNNLSQLYTAVNPGVVNISAAVNSGFQQGMATGSGWIYSDQGYVVTNNHVVEGASEVLVAFYNGVETPATVIGTDPYSDLAVLQVDNLIPEAVALPIGNSDNVQVGEWVVAIGSPFGLGATMTTGIVSAIGRTIEGGNTTFSLPHAIQTDAPINPGNSGGPLLNLEGQVIGINAQIATGGSNQSAGIGFAIPVNVAARVVPVLVEQGSYTWPWVGVSGAPVNYAIQQANDLPDQRGAYIDQVVPGGPADQAGLRGSQGGGFSGSGIPTGGDVVIAVDGQPIANFDDMLAIITTHAPGDVVRLTILRDGQQMEVDVTLEPRDPNYNPDTQQ